ncbi:hypothetical protein GCM10010199_14650 [Dactylosporangium roseum]
MADTHTHDGTPNTPKRVTAAVTAASITASASAHAPPAGAGITGSTATARSSTVNCRRTASARAANRRTQPRTVSGGRPSHPAIRRNPTPAAPGRQRSPDHDHRVRPAQQPLHRQQHMRHPAPGAPRSPGTHRHGTLLPPKPPRPGIPPPRQDTRAARADQPPRNQPPLDRSGVTAYRDHDASTRHRTALPQHSGQRDSGRAVAYQDLITVPPNTNKGNHTVAAPNPSSSPTPPTYPNLLILSAV